MFLKNCKAYLKTMQNELLEIGYASVSVTDKSVDFTSDFVPLMKLGERAKIVCVFKDPETHIYIESHLFEGEVYLSSQKLLRIVDVTDSIMTGSERTLTVDTTLKARVANIPTTNSAHPYRPLIRRWSDITVYLVAVEALRFTSEKSYDKGQKLFLQIKHGPLRLEEVILEIYEVIQFGHKLTGYRCKIERVEEPYKTNLYNFVRNANLVFSDEAIIPPPETIPEALRDRERMEREMFEAAMDVPVAPPDPRSDPGFGAEPKNNPFTNPEYDEEMRRRRLNRPPMFGQFEGAEPKNNPFTQNQNENEK